MRKYEAIYHEYLEICKAEGAIVEDEADRLLQLLLEEYQPDDIWDGAYWTKVEVITDADTEINPNTSLLMMSVNYAQVKVIERERGKNGKVGI